MSFFPFFANEPLNMPILPNMFWNSPLMPIPLPPTQKPGYFRTMDDNGTYTQNPPPNPKAATADTRPQQSPIWTRQQNELLFSYHEELGCKWSEIVLRMPGRTFNDIKNHFYSLLRKGLRRINGVLKQYKIKYKYRSIRERFLLKLSEAMDQKFTSKLGLSATIISQSYSIRNWFLSMSDNSSEEVQNIQQFKQCFKQFLDFDFSFRKHKPVKSKDNGNLKKYYNKIHEVQAQAHTQVPEKSQKRELQALELNRALYRDFGNSAAQSPKLTIVSTTLDQAKQNNGSNESYNVRMLSSEPGVHEEVHETEEKRSTQSTEHNLMQPTGPHSMKISQVESI